jgi:hypothetical protein
MNSGRSATLARCRALKRLIAEIEALCRGGGNSPSLQDALRGLRAELDVAHRRLGAEVAGVQEWMVAMNQMGEHR